MRHLGWTVTVQQRFYDEGGVVMYGPRSMYSGYALVALLKKVISWRGK